MKIEEGMYVRTHNGVIGKIKRIAKQTEAEDLYLFDKVICYNTDLLSKKNVEKIIEKASFNKIDLIEVGDVITIRSNGDLYRYEVEQFDLMREVIGIRIHILGKPVIYTLDELNIVSIVTHEQLRESEYKFDE